MWYINLQKIHIRIDYYITQYLSSCDNVVATILSLHKCTLRQTQYTVVNI